jgi:hypothetical protein
VAWDLRYPSTRALGTGENAGAGGGSGVLAAPGDYTVTLSKEVDGVVTALSGAVPFEVVRMYEGALPGSPDEEVAAWWRDCARLHRATTALSRALNRTVVRVEAMRVALSRTPAAPGELDQQLYDLRQTLYAFDERLNGNRSRRAVGEKIAPTVGGRLGYAMRATANSTYGPTQTARRNLEIAAAGFDELKSAFDDIVERRLPALEKALAEAGAPWVEGQPIPEGE